MQYLLNILEEIWTLLNEMSPYLLLGFLIAGLMHVFVPSTLYTKHLSGRSLRSVILAALFGIPLPLCSCGVIPTAMGIRREGAGKGATVSFLIATPQTGVDSIIATYSLMGLPFAIIRPIVALVTALLGGMFVNVFDNEDEIIIARNKQEKSNSSKTTEKTTNTKDSQRMSWAGKIKETFQYAFVEMMEDIGKWLVIGLVIASIITALVPDEWFAIFQNHSLYSILFVLLFSIPMYLCATGSIPIAVALMMKGLTPGAALVLLMAGPASNAASILVIRKVLGQKSMLLYLISIITGAVVFGLGIDYLLPSEWFTSKLIMRHAGCCQESTSLFQYICTAAMILLLLNALCHKKLSCHYHHNHFHEEECNTETTPYIIYKVKGMNCNHCAENVRKAIASLPDVEDVTVDLEAGQARILGNASEDAIREAVESIGFSLEKP